MAALPSMQRHAAPILHCCNGVGPFMTLRIFVENDEDETRIALHGRFSGEEVAEVERVVSARDKPLRIDLTHLTGVDTAGLQSLRRLQEGGAHVTDASPFIEMMLERAGEDHRQPEEEDNPLVK